MTSKTRLHLVPAALTLALVACEQSITSIADPVVEVEAVTSVALSYVRCVAPGADLISWWPGDGDFEDVTGANPVASTAGVSFVDGVHEEAFRFGGSSTQIEIPDSGTLRPGVFTIDLWAERLGAGQNSDNSYGNMLIQKALKDNELNGSLWSYFVSWRADGHLAAGVYFDNDPTSAGGPVRVVSTDAFPNDTPIFIALSVDGPANGLMVTLYVNGEVQGTFDATGLGSVVYDTGSTVIGSNWRAARNVGFPRTFDGIVDEVEILGSALTQTELQAIHAGGRCRADNEAPEVNEFEGGSIDESGTFGASVSFTDEDSGAWSAVVDYGDGSVESPAMAGNSFDLSHDYDQDGEYTVTVTVTDDAGAEGSASTSVVVNNVAPTVEAGPDATILEGGTFERAGSFTDPGADAWTATVDYGDGSGSQPLPLSGMSFELYHTYSGQGSGPFTVTVTVDDGNGSGVGEVEVTVEEPEVAPVYPLTIDQATVILARRRWWWSKDSYAVSGRLPLGLLQSFDPTTDALAVMFAGVEQVIPPGSLVRKDHEWEFRARRRVAGVHRIHLRDDGRFRIQARGPFAHDLRHVNLRESVDFSLRLGPGVGEASIQLDRRLHYRSRCGRACRDKRDNRDNDDDDDDDRLKKLRRFFARGR
jgi:hypothetical protein